jgi:hypothetical protein
MRIGFTGTREGLSEKQWKDVLDFFVKYGKNITEFHHGDCVGADADAHWIATAHIGLDKIWVHPPEAAQWRAFCKSPHIARPLGYLARNLSIIRSVDRMIACPKEEFEPAQKRGAGTWHAIRHARAQGKPVLIVTP